MYYIEGQSHDPAFNLAMEEHLYRTVDGGHPGYFLLWQNEPSIIVGRFQNTAQEVNRAFVEERGIRVVRRISGGGAVYHDLGNLNYTFIVPNDEGTPSTSPGTPCPWFGPWKNSA
jgi:lipoate-protein ligase A